MMNSTTELLWTLTELDECANRRRKIQIPSASCIVGRGPAADLVINDPSVSKSHVRLAQVADQLIVEDLGSTNGTFVGGEPVEQSAVFDGELLQFGNTVFRVGCQASESTMTTCREISTNWVQTLLRFEGMISQRTVVPHFQPIVSIVNDKIVAFEMLARSKIENLKSAGQLFGTAERVDQAAALSEMMREEGLRCVADAAIDLPVFLNTHPAEFGSERLKQSLKQLRINFPDTKIVLELHEGVITEIDEVRAFRELLTSLDMKLSYDDFGSGQGRLLELTEVPPDVLKFDMRLIRDIDEAPKGRQELLRSLVAAATEAGSITLAEGVQTHQEHDKCREFGFQMGQGYLYGYPMPIDHWRENL